MSLTRGLIFNDRVKMQKTIVPIHGLLNVETFSAQGIYNHWVYNFSLARSGIKLSPPHFVFFILKENISV